jgi:hypothetical protein
LFVFANSRSPSFRPSSPFSLRFRPARDVIYTTSRSGSSLLSLAPLPFVCPVYPPWRPRFSSSKSSSSPLVIGAWPTPPSSRRSETSPRAGSKHPFFSLPCSHSALPPLLLASCLLYRTSAREKGLKAQYWGASVNRARDFYWLLCKSPILSLFSFN